MQYAILVGTGNLCRFETGLRMNAQCFIGCAFLYEIQAGKRKENLLNAF